MLISNNEFHISYKYIRDAAKKGTDTRTVKVFVSNAHADSVCALEILKTLFERDLVEYVVNVVSGYEDLQEKASRVLPGPDDVSEGDYDDVVVLINCGATMPLNELFELPLDNSRRTKVFVIDHHRPIHLSNLSPQNLCVYVLCDKEYEEEEFPKNTEVADLEVEDDDDDDDDDESEDDDDFSDDDGENKENDEDPRLAEERRRDQKAIREIRRRTERADLRKERRRQREMKREEMIEYYERGAYHGKPSGWLLYNVAGLFIDKSDVDGLLWKCIVSITDHYLQCRMPFAAYERAVNEQAQHLATIAADAEENSSSESDADDLDGDGSGGSRRYDDREDDDDDRRRRRRRRHQRRARRAAAAAGSGLAGDRARGTLFRLDDGTEVRTPDYVERIERVDDYRFALLRHWSLIDSIVHSPYVAARLKTWREEGRNQLLTILAVVGIPLDESKQQHTFMKRRSLKILQQSSSSPAQPTPDGEDGPSTLDALLARVARCPDIRMPTFVRHHGYNSSVSASDVVYAITALLESSRKSQNDALLEQGDGDELARGDAEDDAAAAAAALASEEVARSFWRARSALTCDLEQNSELKRGIVLSMRLHRAIIDQGGHAITKKQIRYVHSFRLMDLSGTSRGIGGAILSHPLALCRLAHFTMDVLVQDGKRPKPMVVCAPSISFPSTANPSSSSSADGTGNILVVGTVREGGAYNRFSLAFGRAAERSGADVRTQGFEASWLEIPRSEFNSFLQALEAEQLQKAARRGGEATTAA